MVHRVRARLSYANVMATLSVFLVVAGGTAWALSRNSVKSKHIKNNAVKSTDIKDNTVQFQDLAGVKAWSKRVSATTEAGITPVTLLKRGTITIYATCYQDAQFDFVIATTYVGTSANGAILRTGAGGDLDGTPAYLNTNTPESSRGLYSDSGVFSSAAAATNSVASQKPEFAHFNLITAGHALTLAGESFAVAKNGSPPTGSGPLGSGDRCSFSGYVIG